MEDSYDVVGDRGFLVCFFLQKKAVTFILMIKDKKSIYCVRTHSQALHTRSGVNQASSGTGSLPVEHSSQTPSPRLRLEKISIENDILFLFCLPMMKTMSCCVKRMLTDTADFTFVIRSPIIRSTTFVNPC